LPHPKYLFRYINSKRRKSEYDIGKVREILAAYGFEILGKPKRTIGGLRNQCMIINTPSGKKLLKIYKESLGTSTITQEHSILNYLEEIDFPSVRLESAKNDETLIVIDGQRLSLFQEKHYTFIILLDSNEDDKILYREFQENT
jgi:hypothetical protein